MMKSNVKWMLVFAGLALAACGSDPSGKDAGWDFDDDMGMDAGHDGGGGLDGGGEIDSGGETDGGDNSDAGSNAHPMTFRMTNGSGRPVFAHQSVNGAASCFSGGWLEVVEDGTPRRLTGDCTRCSCEEAPNCVVCEVDCAPGVEPNFAQLPSGESRVFEWDGLLHVDAEREGVPCDATRPPRADVLSARFCWGTGFEATFEPFGEITEIECADVEFSRTDDVVEFEIPPIDSVTSTNFVLRNDTADTLYANFSVAGPCSFGTWLTLEQNSTPLDIYAECGPCRCSEVGTSMCPQLCPAVSCAAPTPEAFELPAGGERSHEWNHVAWQQGEVDGTQCIRDRLVTGIVTAEMCWGTELSDGFAVVDPTCERIDFEVGTDGLVQHTIQ